MVPSADRGRSAADITPNEGPQGPERGLLRPPLRPRILAWGELLWDLFADGPRLGGAAANVAYHAAALGGDVSLVSRVGADALGARARGELAAAGVDVTLVQIDPDAVTGTVAVTFEENEPRYRIATEAAWDRIRWEPGLARAVASAQVLYYGTLAQRSVLSAGALFTAWGAADGKCLRVCDLNVRSPFSSPELIARSVRHADVVKLNETEAALVAEAFSTPEPERWLLAQGVQLVALTRGARGCRLVTATGAVEHAGFAVADGQGDPVGAGDAFVAVLCVELGRTGGLPTDLSRLATRANRFAAHVASCVGAMPPLPADLVAR